MQISVYHEWHFIVKDLVLCVFIDSHVTMYDLKVEFL